MDFARVIPARPQAWGAWIVTALVAAGLAASGVVGPAEALSTKTRKERDKGGQTSKRSETNDKGSKGGTGKEGGGTDDAAALEPVPPAVEPVPIVLKLSSDKALYQPGDRLSIRVEADKPCNLTLISIEATGRATVLFPNDIEQDNALLAATPLTVPASDAGYVLKLTEPGVESVLAICTAKARRPFGIGHDYEHQRFTVLGAWADFEANAAKREADHMSRIAEENRKRSRKRHSLLPQISDPPPGEREPEGRALMLLAVEAPLTSTTARGP